MLYYNVYEIIAVTVYEEMARILKCSLSGFKIITSKWSWRGSTISQNHRATKYKSHSCPSWLGYTGSWQFHKNMTNTSDRLAADVGKLCSVDMKQTQQQNKFCQNLYKMPSVPHQ